MQRQKPRVLSSAVFKPVPVARLRARPGRRPPTDAQKANTSSMSRGFHLSSIFPPHLRQQLGRQSRRIARYAIGAGPLLPGSVASPRRMRSRPPNLEQARPGSRSPRRLRRRLRGLQDRPTRRSPRTCATSRTSSACASWPQPSTSIAAASCGRTATMRGAITQFMRAAEIDPSNQAAQQEIERTQREQPPAGPDRRRPPSPPSSRCRSSGRRSRQHQLHRRPIELKPGLERSHHPAHGRGRQGHLPGDRQAGRAERDLRPRLHLQAHPRRPDQRLAVGGLAHRRHASPAPSTSRSRRTPSSSRRTPAPSAPISTNSPSRPFICRTPRSPTTATKS